VLSVCRVYGVVLLSDLTVHDVVILFVLVYGVVLLFFRYIMLYGYSLCLCCPPSSHFFDTDIVYLTYLLSKLKGHYLP